MLTAAIITFVSTCSWSSVSISTCFWSRLKKVFLYSWVSNSRSWSWWSRHLRPPCLNNSLLSIKFKSNMCIKYYLFHLFFIIWLTRFATAFNWVIIRNYKMDYFFTILSDDGRRRIVKGKKDMYYEQFFKYFFLSHAHCCIFFVIFLRQKKRLIFLNKKQSI